jgi:hypothetical protein
MAFTCNALTGAAGLVDWALLVDTQTYVSMVWAGLGVGCAVLVVIYILIRFMSILHYGLPMPQGENVAQITTGASKEGRLVFSFPLD